MKYSFLLFKRLIEDLFIYPFILVGRLIAFFQPLKKEYNVFFFFPFYHTGGAEKIHAQIASATGDSNCIIFFTKKSADNRFWDEFVRTGCELKDVSRFTDNKWLYFLNLIYRGIISGHVNRQQRKPVVFNGQCNFGYKISPWIKKNIPQIELIHSLNTFSYIRIPFLPFITKTVMISKKRIEDHKNLYKEYGIPDNLLSKIIHIPNAIKIPSQTITEKNNQFTVLYVGRGTSEKRVHLVVEIARQLNDKNEGIRFEIVGDTFLSTNNYPFLKFYGNVSDEKKISETYSKAHLIILTSSTEGFPMVIMEAMAHGCVVLSTAVGDIPYNIINGENGYLFSNTDDEQLIIKEAIEKINWLKNHQGEWQRISANNIDYANHNFGIERFNKDYQELFFSLKNTD